jgi:putative NADH-flavin reductase
MNLLLINSSTRNLGSAIFKELLKSDLFEITVLTRQSNNHPFPSDVKVAKVDYTSVESLTYALEDQHALISTLASLALPTQKLLIDAAVKAGVERTIPSELGCDVKNPKARNYSCLCCQG